MRRNFTITILFCFILLGASAQDNNSNTAKAKKETQRLVQLLGGLEGTYQVQIIDSREEVAFPLATLDLIVAKRAKTDTVYFWMKDKVRIMVLPSDGLAKKDFKPLKRIVHISSESLK